MIDLAYVQRKDRDWLNETSFTLVSGLRLFGVEVQGFEPEDLPVLEITPGTLVHGGIGTVRRALAGLGVPEPDVFCGLPPPELLPFYGRRVWASTMGHVRARLDADEHLFVKPLRRQKAFTGLVTSSRMGDLARIACFENDFEVLCSDPVDFVSEYRCFILHGELIGLRHYAGDFMRPVDSGVVYRALAAWHGPAGYALDFGLTADGRTLLVEGNDAFALGCYGLPSALYARLVMGRWEQLAAQATRVALPS